MIKVLCVTGGFVKTGGVTGVIMNYFRHINRDKIKMDFLILSRRSAESIREEIENRGSQVYYVPILDGKNILKIWNLLQDFFKKYGSRYLIIHSHLYQLDWLLFYLARKSGIKICISHAHTTKWADYKFRAARNHVLALPVPYCADVWGACSLAAGEFLYGKSFTQSPKKWIMRNAIDTKRFAFSEEGRKKARKEFGYTDEIVLGNVGRLAPQKNQSFLMDVMKSLIDQGQTQYRMLIVGEGDLRDELTEKMKRLGVQEYVTFAGTRTDIPEMLWAMDIFLLPSYYEGLPVSGIEAQAAGLPCLFSDRITKEVGIVNTTYLSIDNGSDVWCKAIMSLQPDKIVRANAAHKVVSAGYDIENEAGSLVQHYLELAMTE